MKLREEWPTADPDQGFGFPREPIQDATEERKRMMALLFGETTEEKLANVRALMGGDGLK